LRHTASAKSTGRNGARRLQAAEACEGAGLQNMVAACCAADGPGQNGGHRRVRAAAPGLAGPGGRDWPDARAPPPTTAADRLRHLPLHGPGRPGGGHAPLASRAVKNRVCSASFVRGA
jgi:hypothetical protein